MRILTLSNLYPNPEQPRKGVFVRERLRHLVADGNVEATVIAPVPWFPFRHAAFGQYGEFARVGAESDDGGRTVLHPRYALLPKLGASFAPRSYAAAVRRTLARHRLGAFDVIDAHFLFPDGAAAVLLGRALGLPVVVTARGSDANVMPASRFAGPWIRRTLRECDAAVAVSAALAERLVALGAEPGRVHVLRNGVDRERFRVGDARGSRERLGLEGRVVLSVGNLIPLKGHDLVIRALRRDASSTLVIVGRGPEEDVLRRLAGELGLASRVRFVAEITQDALVDYYNAADVLVLASSSEGMPNVVLESMACGTPVVATAVGGSVEVLEGSATGALVRERTPEAIAEAIECVLARPADPQRVAEEVSDFDWALTSRRLRHLFAALAADGPHHRH